MAFFAVSYDLVKEKSGHDYQPLWDAFAKEDSVKALLSLYLVSKDATLRQVSNYFAQYIDDNDRLMVVEFRSKPSYPTALKGTNAWIEKHFP